MKTLDQIIYKFLPDDGLCERGKKKQADRREKLKQAIIQAYVLTEISNQISHRSDPVSYFGEVRVPDLIIDEIQLDLLAEKKEYIVRPSAKNFIKSSHDQRRTPSKI